MDFEVILTDMEKLIGKELTPINPKTGSIIISHIDRLQKSYSVKPAEGRVVKRSFSELLKIWEQLYIQRAINVEVVLEGAGSSRHHPETILAHLSYVDYFKFRNKKHLYLHDDATHELGTINLLSGPLLREAKRVLDGQDNFDRHIFSAQFKASLSILKEAVEEISVKYPGELQSSDLSKSMTELSRLQGVIEGTIIEVNDLASNLKYSNMDHLEISNVDDLLDEIESRDVDDGDVDKRDSDIQLEYAEDGQSKELSAARIRHLAPTFSLVYDRMQHDEIEMQPGFQRRDRIWKTSDKSALVESILIGLPIPNLYFAERNNGDWVIVDGLQRLTTLKDYIQGKFELSGLSILGNLNGLSFEGLSRYYQRKFREYTLHSHIITMKNNDDTMIKELFQRINTYGASLSYQEIRCALYVGSSVSFIRYFAESDIFTNTTFSKINSKRMRDMEFVLGATAFILFGYENYAYNRFDAFLGQTMEALNEFELNITGDFLTSQDATKKEPIPPQWHIQGTSDIYIELKEKLEKAFQVTELVFGNDRYQKAPGGRIVVSKPLFELITTVFASLKPKQIEILIDKRDAFKKEFKKLLDGERKPSHNWDSQIYEDEARGFMYSISQSTGKRVTVLYRFQNFQSLIEDIIGEPIQINGLLTKYDY